MAKAPSFDTSCKIGTIPKLVRLHGGDKVEVDRLVRVQEQEGDRWAAVLVTKINPDGFFFADHWTSWAPRGCAQPAAGQYSYPENALVD